MAAVRDALCAHGSADLTMQDIAAEADRSSAALHYHYDTKRELLATFLRFLHDRVKRHLEDLQDQPPIERLQELLDHLLEGPDPEEERLFTALATLRAQAPHVEAYRDKLRDIEATLRDFVVASIHEGIAQDQITCPNPEATARLLLAATRGARDNRVLLADDEETDHVRSAVYEHILADIGIEEGQT